MSRPPVNAELNKLLKTPPRFFETPPTTTASRVPITSSTSTTEFSQVHLESRTETPSANGDRHEQNARKLGREKSLLLKQYGKLELRIEKARAALRSAKANTDDEDTSSRENELHQLKKEKRRIARRIERLGSANGSDTSGSSDEQDISSPYKPPEKTAAEIRKKIDDTHDEIQRELVAGNEKKVEKLRQEVTDLENDLKRFSPKREGGNISRLPINPAIPSKTPSESKATTKDLIGISTTLRDQNLNILQDKKSELEKLRGTDENDKAINECVKEIRRLEQQIKAFDELLATISSAPLATDSSLISTLTRRGRRPTQLPSPKESDSTSKLSNLATEKRRSSLLLGDAMKSYFSKEGLEELEEIETKLEQQIEDLDAFSADIKKWKRQVDDASHSHDRVDFEGLLKRAEANAHRTTLRIAKLIEKRQKLEALVFPQQSRKQKDEEREKFLHQFKSEKTKKLEAIRKQKLADLERRVQADCGASMMYYVSGLAAFGSSFFVGNGLSRAPYPGSAIVGSFVAAFLHVTAAGPVLKQLLAKSWTAPAFVEFNNYVKLVGSKWADEANGETKVKKYVSKSPDRPGLLDIEERLAEERPFSEILRDRMSSEDASYFFYMLNYLGKAAIVSGAASYFAAGTVTTILLELFLHSVLGALSGAETVAGIQHTRSKEPNSELKAAPTREIFAAEAEEKESWLADLKQALSDWQAEHGNNPDDPAGIELIMEIGRTQKALEAARTKSGFAGTFRHEFLAQFQSGEPGADTTSEVLGRWISVLPSAIASELTRGLRKSPDPAWAFAGHAIPAALLIFPPGFSIRAVYSGLIRARVQQSMTNPVGHLAANAPGQPPQEAGFTGVPTEYDVGRQDWM